MKLSEYIKQCQDLLDKYGDTEFLYQEQDEEGNGYNRVSYGPELRLLMPDESEYRPEYLVPHHHNENIDVWLDDFEFDEEDLKLAKTVILL